MMVYFKHLTIINEHITFVCLNWTIICSFDHNWEAVPIVLSRAGEQGVFGSLEPVSEPEPLEKNRSRSRLEKKPGAGAAKKWAGFSAMREDKKHKEIAL